MFDVKHILVPMDYSDVARAALSMALQVADRHGARITMLHVQGGLDKDLQNRLVSAPNDHVIEEGIETAERSLMDAVDMEFQRAVDKGHQLKRGPIAFHVAGGSFQQVALQMVEEEDVDLIVTGTHGRQGFRDSIFGSSSEVLVRQAPCSVFVVKPQGYPYLRD